MTDHTPITRVFGHGGIKLTYYPSSQRVGIDVTATNAVMDACELAMFVRLYIDPKPADV